MGRVVLDSAALAKLKDITDRVALLDEAGRVVGYFAPAGSANEPQWDEEELQRSERERGGRPLKDIIADWKRSP